MASEIDNILQDIGFAQVIVQLKEGPSSALATRGAHGALTASLAVRAIPDLMSLFISRREIGAPLAASRRRGVARASLPTRAAPASAVSAALFPKLGLAVGLVDKAAADALRAHPSVQQMVPAPVPSLIRPMRAAAAPAPKQATWGITQMKIASLWNRGLDGKGVVVGHLDTGVDGSHPALTGAIAEFAEFDMAGKQVPGAVAHDSDEHGTHTAGTIAGRSMNGRSVGVAPGAKLASGLVVEGGDVITRVLSGMEWIAARNVRILSMSLGVRGYRTTFKVVVDALRKNNILPVFAVGNEGVNTSRFPGNYDNVLSVGAFAANGTIADFSSSEVFARAINPSVPYLVGPGVDVISCMPGGGFQSMDGTSMATPHIAGLAALLLQANPAATLTQLGDAVTRSCTLGASMTAARAGAGAPDAEVALNLIMAGAPLPEIVSTARRKPATKRKTRGGGSRKAPAARKRKATKKKTSKRRGGYGS